MLRLALVACVLLAAALSQSNVNLARSRGPNRNEAWPTCQVYVCVWGGCVCVGERSREARLDLI
jgi:hypothetical protein